MAEIRNILIRISEIFETLTLNYVIVGGLAAIIMGKPRTTMDIDIIIEDDKSKITLFLKMLKSRNFDVLDDQINMAFDSGVNASVFDESSPMRLDIKLARKPIDKAALKSAIANDYFGVPLKIASLGFILLGKIWFLGDISNIDDSELLEYNDVKDFINVYIENKNQVDISWLKKHVDKLGFLATLTRILKYIKQNFE